MLPRFCTHKVLLSMTDYLAHVLLLFIQENLDLKAAYENIQKELKVMFHLRIMFSLIPKPHTSSSCMAWVRDYII